MPTLGSSRLVPGGGGGAPGPLLAGRLRAPLAVRLAVRGSEGKQGSAWKCRPLTTCFPRDPEPSFLSKSDQERALAGSGMDPEASSEENREPALRIGAWDTPAPHVGIPSPLGLMTVLSSP